MRHPTDVARTVLTHYEREESRRQGRRIFSDIANSWVLWFTLEDFAQRFGLSPEEVERLLPPLKGRGQE